eukprot:TRINITY_DN1171_c1_g2_i7.p1 TRINITY_DN1171_c1_g2~~TRINITY_DN1171_c1_g2_i7.p1  ORF type:complete len:283 (+),score=32.72 TRINITY_DN1171_c1_g2_i7:877-1725(+)
MRVILFALFFTILFAFTSAQDQCASCEEDDCVADCADDTCTCAKCKGARCTAKCSKGECSFVECNGNGERCSADCSSIMAPTKKKCGNVIAFGDNSEALCSGGSTCGLVECTGAGCFVTVQQDGTASQRASCDGDSCSVDCSRNAKCATAKCTGDTCRTSCSQTTLSGGCGTAECDGKQCGVFCTEGKCDKMIAKEESSFATCSGGKCMQGQCEGVGCFVSCPSCNDVSCTGALCSVSCVGGNCKASCNGGECQEDPQTCQACNLALDVCVCQADNYCPCPP